MRRQRDGGVVHTVLTRSWCALVLGGVAILCVPLLGHHSFAVYYIEADTIEVEGDIVEFQRAGISKDTLRAGDSVRIWASPNKNPSDNRVRLKRIERRSDGWQWGQNRRDSR
jgi:hypothetical protein